MKKLFCDWCGISEDDCKGYILEVNISGKDIDYTFELCPECRDKIRDFLNEKEAY